MASHEPTVPPISKIHDDILWYIFHLNSQLVDYTGEDVLTGVKIFLDVYFMQHDSATSLVINRRTSHVCRRWREIIVNSPTIWADSLPLQILNQKGDEWRNEVIKRTGDAPLSIFGYVGREETMGTTRSHNLRTVPFLLHLLKTHWDRVRTLIIYSYDAAIDEQLHIISSRPAPNLEKFIIGLHQTRVGVGKDDISFMNHAPHLRTLSTHGLSFTFSASSWSFNILHLNLSWSRRDMSIPELFHGLENMTSLETLRLCDVTNDYRMNVVPPNSTIPTIKLSNLRNLRVQDSNSALPHLISHILIPSQCTVKIVVSASLDRHANVHERIALGCTTLLQHNFPPSNMTDLCYSLQYTPLGYGDDPVEDSYHILKITINQSAQARNQRPFFDYQAYMIGLSSLPLSMARALLSYDLSNITTFTLIFTARKRDDALEDQLFRDIYDFFLALKSVKILHTNDATLQFYMGLKDLGVRSVLFPRLVSVVTDTWGTGIHQFLEYRHAKSKEPGEDRPKFIECLGFEGRSTRVPVNLLTKFGKVSTVGDGVLRFAI